MMNESVMQMSLRYLMSNIHWDEGNIEIMVILILGQTSVFLVPILKCIFKGILHNMELKYYIWCYFVCERYWPLFCILPFEIPYQDYVILMFFFILFFSKIWLVWMPCWLIIVSMGVWGGSIGRASTRDPKRRGSNPIRSTRNENFSESKCCAD